DHAARRAAAQPRARLRSRVRRGAGAGDGDADRGADRAARLRRGRLRPARARPGAPGGARLGRRDRCDRGGPGAEAVVSEPATRRRGRRAGWIVALVALATLGANLTWIGGHLDWL